MELTDNDKDIIDNALELFKDASYRLVPLMPLEDYIGLSIDIDSIREKLGLDGDE